MTRRIRYLILRIKERLGIAEEGRDYMTAPNQPMQMPEEFRCCICQSRNDCPASDTGVIFPCAYFKAEAVGRRRTIVTQNHIQDALDPTCSE